MTEWVADFNSFNDYLSLRYLQNFTYHAYRDGNITVHRVPRFSPALFVPALRHLNTAVFSRIADRIIRHYRIDVVVGTFPLPAPQAPRLVFDLFDDNVSYWQSVGRAPGYAAEIAHIESAYLQKADVVVAASTVLADKARTLGARGQICHIPNGVDLCLFDGLDGAKARSELGIRGKLVGSIANYDRATELDKVVDAAKLLAGKEIVLIIAGRGAAMRSAKQRAEREGVTNLIFRGYVPPAEAPGLVSAFDVGLCTYTRTPMDDARSPMRLLMYAAAGLPTVCTNLEEVRRMQFSNVVLAEDDPRSLAEAIQSALELPRLRPPQIKSYDLPRLVEQYEAVLHG